VHQQHVPRKKTESHITPEGWCQSILCAGLCPLSQGPRCVRECPSHAISIVDGHVAIESRQCVKCGRCVEIAHYGGITYDWNATPEHYNETVAY
jgi:uncharacterized Fe-S center protein